MNGLNPLQIGGLLFPLFGLVFAIIGAFNLIKPREMAAYTIRRRTGGEIEGQIEPTPTRLMFARLMGAVMLVIGLGLALGLMNPEIHKPESRPLSPSASRTT